MRNRVVEEKMDDIERLIDVIYSAGMDEESEELQEIWNSLVGEIERLGTALHTHQSYDRTVSEFHGDTEKYRIALEEIRTTVKSSFEETAIKRRMIAEKVLGYMP